MRRTSASPALISSLARAAMTDVASVSAGPPCGGLYLKPPSAGGLCDGVTTMPSARPGAGLPAAVRLDDRVGNRRRRRVTVVGVDQHRHVVGREYLERRRPRRLGQPVGVAADEQRAVVALLLAVVADRLRGRQDVRLVERRLEAAAAVPARPERDLLVDVVGVGHARVVRRHEVRDVDQVGGSGEGSCAGAAVGGHAAIMPRQLLVEEGRRPVARPGETSANLSWWFRDGPIIDQGVPPRPSGEPRCVERGTRLGNIAGTTCTRRSPNRSTAARGSVC